MLEARIQERPKGLFLGDGSSTTEQGRAQDSRSLIQLGMPFSLAVFIIQKMDSFVKQVQVWYSNENPLDNDLVICLSNDGIRFIFDSYTQQLKIIDLYDLNKVTLFYGDKLFNGASAEPTYGEIDQTFGPSFPMEAETESVEGKNLFTKRLRGYTFIFQADKTSRPVYNEVTGCHKVKLLPNSKLTCIAMKIYDGASVKQSVVPDLPIGFLEDKLILESALVERKHKQTDQIKLKLKRPKRIGTGTWETFERSLIFGMSCQEVQSEVGAPSRVFYKGKDQMRIIYHNESRRSEPLTPRSDFVYNYFNLGMDLVFDGITHKVKKIILHTNYPGHYDFNMYLRCNFALPLHHVNERTLETRMANPYRADCLNITPFTKWSDIEAFEQQNNTDIRQKPIVGHREGSINSDNRFGDTFFYGYQDMAFEVMQNGHIASVLIYENSNKGS